MKILQPLQSIATLVMLFLFLWQWNKNGKVKDGTTTIIHHYHDSTKAQAATEINVRPGTVPVSVPVYITIPPANGQPGRIDTLYKPLDSLEVVKAFFAHHYYADTAETKFGKIWASWKTHMNISDSIKFGWNIDVPETIRTVNRGQVYLGVEGLGGKPNLLNGFGGNVAYKTKGNKIYEVGVVKISGLPIQYKGGFKMLLSLKPK